MRRYFGLLLVFCTGCSTAPIAGFLDNVRPSKARIKSNGTDRPGDPFLAEPRPPEGAVPVAPIPPVPPPPTSPGISPVVPPPTTGSPFDPAPVRPLTLPNT